METQAPPITIEVTTEYLARQSDPASRRYAFAYTITLINTGSLPARLVSRHWIITDANNEVQEVRGIGVVGEQPLLSPGQRYRYTSGTTLTTPAGSMRGGYLFIASNGERFEAPVAEFSLYEPGTLH